MTEKPRFSLTIPEDMLEEIESFQIKHGYKTRNRAIQELVKIGIEQLRRQGMLSAKPVPEYSELALKVAKKFDSLDEHGKKVVRYITEMEESRVKQIAKLGNALYGRQRLVARSGLDTDITTAPVTIPDDDLDVPV